MDPNTKAIDVKTMAQKCKENKSWTEYIKNMFDAFREFISTQFPMNNIF